MLPRIAVRFAVTPEYLESTPRGLASGQWLHDYGLQTTRGFRALKVWMALKEHGIEKFGRLIDQNIAQGHYLGDVDRGRAALWSWSRRPSINIVCFRYRATGRRASGSKALNTEIMLRLQEEGIAALSDTTVHGAALPAGGDQQSPDPARRSGHARRGNVASRCTAGTMTSDRTSG